MAITAIRHGITLDELDAWGSVADLGSEILEGEVKAFGKMTAGAPTDPVSAAYFGTTAGKFRMTYPFSEQATVVSGEVRLTDESTGQSTLYKAGDSWFVSKGTPVLWEVADGGFVKHYYAVARHRRNGEPLRPEALPALDTPRRANNRSRLSAVKPGVTADAPAALFALLGKPFRPEALPSPRHVPVGRITARGYPP